MTDRYRVVQWATGNIGTKSLRAVIEHPQLDLVGVRVHADDKVGRDAVHTCPGAPVARAEARVSIERLLDRLSDIRISERVHGPAGDRRYTYVPTHILRGLRKLQLEFTPAH